MKEIPEEIRQQIRDEWGRSGILPYGELRKRYPALKEEIDEAMIDFITDEMEEWLMTEASDGFTVQFPYLPGGLDDFCAQVVPELQRRGLFRREYEGKTLRENLGLPRPDNRFFRA